MSRSNKAPVPGNAVTWCWRRWIQSGREDIWTERFQAQNGITWAMTERPDRTRILLEVYGRRSTVISLANEHGGRVRSVKAREWIQARRGIPVQIGNRLRIVHDLPRAGEKQLVPRLHVPHGLAFGSGEHATTRMLLQALAGHQDWSKTRVLDLGTGSGILALAARRFGAEKIVATDFDPEAIRTARQNEALNFPRPAVGWRCADVKRLRATARYNLVLANLFSRILCEAAPRISATLVPGGCLWISGILRSQRKEVVAAYRREGLQLVRSVSRGKWVMLQWTRPARLTSQGSIAARRRGPAA